MKPFGYVAPKNLEEACSFLADHPEAKVLAGGQSLIPIMKLGLAEVDWLVDLKRIRGLSNVSIARDGFSNGEDALQVGALVTHSKLAESETVAVHAPLLSDTARGIGHPLVRNRGTIGGSLSHCDPAADLCAAALALEAEMVLAGPKGNKRQLRAEEFLLGTFTTALQKGEILERIHFPIARPGTGHSIRKFTLGHGDFPIFLVCVVIRVRMGGLEKVAISLGGVSDKAIRIREAEEYLMNAKTITKVILANAAEVVAKSCAPASHDEISKDYATRMTKVLTRRALTEAAERAGTGK